MIRLKKYLEILKKKMNKLRKTGFFSIFISSIFGKVITFFSGIILVRIMTPDEYGLYTYILNTIAILTLFNDFGVGQASLQFLTENKNELEKQKRILFWGLKIGFFASALSGLLILFSSIYFPFKIEEAKNYVPILFLLPVLNLINGLIPVILRSHLENKNYAKLQFVTTFVNYAVLLPMTLFFGLFGAVLSQYIYSIIIIIYGIFLIKKFIRDIKGIKIKKKEEKNEYKSFIKYSLTSQISSTIGGYLLIIDTFLVGILVADTSVLANYKVASIIPNALAFLPTCVIVYILPYFIQHNKEYDWIKNKLKKLIKYGAIIYGLIVFSLILLSKPIFFILFGKEYYSAILTFIILIIGFFFSSTFKIPCANITYSLKKVKVNLIVNIVCVVINFISNILFINLFGYIGAAITTTVINIFSSMFYLIYIYKLLRKGGNDK